MNLSVDGIAQDDFSIMRSLQKLDLKSNQLKDFPDELSSMEFVQEIDVRNNHLKNFPLGFSKQNKITKFET